MIAKLLIILGTAGWLGAESRAAGTQTNHPPDEVDTYDSWVAKPQTNHPPNEVMPLISMEDVGLRDAIRALARQERVNFILDPAILASFAGPWDRFVNEPRVNSRWTNVTAGEALDDLLKAYQMTVVSNPATSVARIAFVKQNVEPVSASELSNDTSDRMPLIQMDEVRLTDAIRNIARKADLSYILDPALNSPAAESGGRELLQSLVNIRWQNITLKQALVALLDDYGLAMVQNPGDASFRITSKVPPAPRKKALRGVTVPSLKTSA